MLLLLGYRLLAAADGNHVVQLGCCPLAYSVYCRLLPICKSEFKAFGKRH
jgi:hypothetical protein